MVLRNVARNLLLNLESPVLASIWQTLIQLVEDGVAAWPAGSVESDEALLASSTTLRPNQRLAIEFRLSQRRLARILLQLYQERADELLVKAWGSPPTSPKGAPKTQNGAQANGTHVNGKATNGSGAKPKKSANGTAKDRASVPQSDY